MGNYVLCHGGWAGGWMWRDVAMLLRSAGHQVFTPTFTGLGQRVHLSDPEVDLNTYIEDILMVLKYEDLEDVILVGYSISGAVISGVAERAAHKIKHLVYLDAYVLQDGQSLADQIDRALMDFLQGRADEVGDGWRIPHEPPDAERRTDQSIKPVLTPLKIRNESAAALPRTFIYCTQGAQDVGPFHEPIAQAAQKVRQNEQWRYHELDTGHTPMWSLPQETADLLLQVA